MSTPWKTENWFVSPWNYLDEVTKDFTPPKKVIVHDVTLRDGEQQAGVVFTKDDKVRIAEKLAEIGVHRIEAGMPAVSPPDEAAIKEIVKRNLGPEIFCFTRCMVDDVKKAVDCGVKGIVIEIPASAHLVEHAYKWPLEKAIDLSIKATAFAKTQGLYTVFFTIDGTRTDMDWLLKLVNRVATEGHMDAFTLVDTFGVLSPQGATYFTRKIKENVKKPLEIHFHSDFGLGVANTLMAVLSGAEVLHTTIGGIGERCGNAPMEETVLALLTFYGIDSREHLLYVGHNLVEIQDLGLENLLAAERQQLMGQRRRPRGSAADLIDAVLHPFGQVRLGRKKVRVPENDIHKIVEIVGDASRQPADRFQLLHAAQLFLQLHALGDVGGDTNDPAQIPRVISRWGPSRLIGSLQLWQLIDDCEFFP